MAQVNQESLACICLSDIADFDSKELGLDQRKDANKEHCLKFYEVAGRRFQTPFAVFAEEQVNLSALVVHPDFRRRGAGTMLVDWGIKAAYGKGWPVTLYTSPMGKLLYQHLGFQPITTERVRVEDEDETLVSQVMALREEWLDLASGRKA